MHHPITVISFVVRKSVRARVDDSGGRERERRTLRMCGIVYVSSFSGVGRGCPMSLGGERHLRRS